MFLSDWGDDNVVESFAGLAVVCFLEVVPALPHNAVLPFLLCDSMYFPNRGSIAPLPKATLAKFAARTPAYMLQPMLEAAKAAAQRHAPPAGVSVAGNGAAALSSRNKKPYGTHPGGHGYPPGRYGGVQSPDGSAMPASKREREAARREIKRRIALQGSQAVMGISAEGGSVNMAPEPVRYDILGRITWPKIVPQTRPLSAEVRRLGSRVDDEVHKYQADLPVLAAADDAASASAAEAAFEERGRAMCDRTEWKTAPAGCDVDAFVSNVRLVSRLLRTGTRVGAPHPVRHRVWPAILLAFQTGLTPGGGTTHPAPSAAVAEEIVDAVSELPVESAGSVQQRVDATADPLPASDDHRAVLHGFAVATSAAPTTSFTVAAPGEAIVCFFDVQQPVRVRLESLRTTSVQRLVTDEEALGELRKCGYDAAAALRVVTDLCVARRAIALTAAAAAVPPSGAVAAAAAAPAVSHGTAGLTPPASAAGLPAHLADSDPLAPGSMSVSAIGADSDCGAVPAAPPSGSGQSRTGELTDATLATAAEAVHTPHGDGSVALPAPVAPVSGRELATPVLSAAASPSAAAAGGAAAAATATPADASGGAAAATAAERPAKREAATSATAEFLALRAKQNGEVVPASLDLARGRAAVAMASNATGEGHSVGETLLAMTSYAELAAVPRLSSDAGLVSAYHLTDWTWSRELQLQFARALNRFGKNFTQVARMVSGKTKAECVAFYFRNKHFRMLLCGIGYHSLNPSVRPGTRTSAWQRSTQPSAEATQRAARTAAARAALKAKHSAAALAGQEDADSSDGESIADGGTDAADAESSSVKGSGAGRVHVGAKRKHDAVEGSATASAGPADEEDVDMAAAQCSSAGLTGADPSPSSSASGSRSTSPSRAGSRHGLSDASSPDRVDGAVPTTAAAAAGGVANVSGAASNASSSDSSDADADGDTAGIIELADDAYQGDGAADDGAAPAAADPASTTADAQAAPPVEVVQASSSPALPAASEAPEGADKTAAAALREGRSDEDVPSSDASSSSDGEADGGESDSDEDSEAGIRELPDDNAGNAEDDAGVEAGAEQSEEDNPDTRATYRRRPSRRFYRGPSRRAREREKQRRRDRRAAERAAKQAAAAAAAAAAGGIVELDEADAEAEEEAAAGDPQDADADGEGNGSGDSPTRTEPKRRKFVREELSTLVNYGRVSRDTIMVGPDAQLEAALAGMAPATDAADASDTALVVRTRSNIRSARGSGTLLSAAGVIERTISSARWCSVCHKYSLSIMVCCNSACSSTMCDSCFRGKVRVSPHRLRCVSVCRSCSPLSAFVRSCRRVFFSRASGSLARSLAQQRPHTSLAISCVFMLQLQSLRTPGKPSWKLARNNPWWMCFDCCPPVPSKSEWATYMLWTEPLLRLHALTNSLNNPLNDGVKTRASATRRSAVVAAIAGNGDVVLRAPSGSRGADGSASGSDIEGGDSANMRRPVRRPVALPSRYYGFADPTTMTFTNSKTRVGPAPKPGPRPATRPAPVPAAKAGVLAGGAGVGGSVKVEAGGSSHAAGALAAGGSAAAKAKNPQPSGAPAGAKPRPAAAPKPAGPRPSTAVGGPGATAGAAAGTKPAPPAKNSAHVNQAHEFLNEYVRRTCGLSGVVASFVCSCMRTDLLACCLTAALSPLHAYASHIRLAPHMCSLRKQLGSGSDPIREFLGLLHSYKMASIPVDDLILRVMALFKRAGVPRALYEASCHVRRRGVSLVNTLLAPAYLTPLRFPICAWPHFFHMQAGF